MKALIVSLIAVALGALALADDAQAARLGGGRSLGSQRQMTAPQKQATPPAQQQQPASGAAARRVSRWLGPLAGLAAGLGLGWLFAQGGFGSAIGVLLMALLAGVAVFALDAHSSQGAIPGIAHCSTPASATRPSPRRRLRSFPATRAPARLPQPVRVRISRRASIVDGLLEEAQRNFLRLQEANDRGDLVRLRQVTTQEMFDALKGDAGGAPGRAADRRGHAERVAARARHRGRSALGERAVFRLDPRRVERAGRAVRGDLEPVQAGERLLGLAARRNTADALIAGRPARLQPCSSAARSPD